jgi:hypothetical protein
MVQARRTLALRWVLPIAQLVLCVVVVWPLRGALVQQVRHSLRAYRSGKTQPPELLKDQQFGIVALDPLTPQQRRSLEVSEIREWVPMMLNLPSFLVQLPYAILSPAKQEWVPRGMELMMWRVISWPLVGILFWWSAGRGIEALLAARRHLVQPQISWIETVVGAALFLFCSVAAVCVPLSAGVEDGFSLKPLVAGLGTWAALGAAMVAARVTQWRTRRGLESTVAGISEIASASRPSP